MSSPRSDDGAEQAQAAVDRSGERSGDRAPGEPDVADSPLPDATVDSGTTADDAPPPAERALYTSDQQRVLRLALAAGTTLPACPACGGAMTRRPIGGGSFGLGYARRREWLLCAGCHRSAIFDVRRGTRT